MNQPLQKGTEDKNKGEGLDVSKQPTRPVGTALDKSTSTLDGWRGDAEGVHASWLRRQVHEHASDWVNVLLAAAIVYFAWASGDQTDRIMKAAEENAQAARSFAATAREIHGDIRKAENNVLSIATSAESSIAAAREALRTEQRAWVGVMGYGKVTLEVGKHFTVRVGFKNSGKTPAIDVRTSVVIEPVMDNGLPDFNNLPKPKSRGVLPPGEEVYAQSVVTEKSPTGLSERGVELIKSGRQTVYVFGTIWYADVFNVPHWTRFCNYLNPTTLAFDVCRQNNAVDTNH